MYKCLDLHALSLNTEKAFDKAIWKYCIYFQGCSKWSLIHIIQLKILRSSISFLIQLEVQNQNRCSFVSLIRENCSFFLITLHMTHSQANVMQRIQRTMLCLYMSHAPMYHKTNRQKKKKKKISFQMAKQKTCLKRNVAFLRPKIVSRIHTV